MIGVLLGFDLALGLFNYKLSCLGARCDEIISEGLEGVAAVEVIHRYRALVEQCVGESLDVVEEYLKALGKIQMQCFVSQVTQNGDLCQGFNGKNLSVGADGDALVFVNIVVELAGEVHTVKTVLTLYMNVGAAPCSKGSGGVHCDHIVALAAVEADAAARNGLAIQLCGDEIQCCLQQVLCEGEVAATADAEPILAIAAVHGDIGCAHVHCKAELIQSIAIRVGIAEKGQNDIAGVNELDAAHILAFAKAHIHTHSGRVVQRAANTLGKDRGQGIDNITHRRVGAAEGRQLADGFHIRLLYRHRGRHIGLSSHFQNHRVIACAAVHLDIGLILATLNVGYGQIDGVILLGAVVLHTGCILDADRITGGQIQTCKQRIEPFDIDMDAALQLYIAFGLCVDFNDLSQLILHNGVMGHNANGSLLGGVLFRAQKI